MGEKKPLEKPELSTTSSTTVAPKNGLREYYFGTMTSQLFLKLLSTELAMEYAAPKEPAYDKQNPLAPTILSCSCSVFFGGRIS
jgi:hypothetical protein